MPMMNSLCLELKKTAAGLFFILFFYLTGYDISTTTTGSRVRLIAPPKNQYKLWFMWVSQSYFWLKEKPQENRKCYGEELLEKCVRENN